VKTDRNLIVCYNISLGVSINTARRLLSSVTTMQSALSIASTIILLGESTICDITLHYMTLG